MSIAPAEAAQIAATANHTALSRMTLLQIQQQLSAGTLSSETLIAYYQTRIKLLDRQGPALQAITDINPNALEEAKQRDQERMNGHIRGPLHGIPVVLKANIATADQMPTTAGALVLKDFVTTQDADLVKNLRAAGAIILAKTNLSEWANFRGDGSASGWSALGGQTKNPYVLSQSPCGSSSGSAVAVAADLALLAVGTETDGSITCPAAVNGIVGIKPTLEALMGGAVSGHGIIPIAKSQDIAGPMTRTVADAAALLQVIATQQAKEQWGDLTESLAKQQVKKVILVRQYDKDFPAIAKMMSTLKQHLQTLGIEVTDKDEWVLPEQVYKDEFFVLLYEYKRDLNQWLSDFKAPQQANNIQSIIAFNQAKGKAALAFYGQQYFEQAQAIDLAKQAKQYQQARQHSHTAARALLDADLGPAQVVIVPTTTAAWAIDHVKGDQYSFGSSSAAAIAGYPSLALPAGFDGKLPLGVSIIAKPYQEPLILGLAQALEQKLAPWPAPDYAPSLQ